MTEFEPVRRRGRPANSSEIRRAKFETRYGRGTVERFIRRCREGTLQDAANGFGMRHPATAWWWYRHLTGERQKPRPPKTETPTSVGRRGRPPGSLGRPDVTAERIRALQYTRMSTVSIARQLHVSRPTIYHRLDGT